MRRQTRCGGVKRVETGRIAIHRMAAGAPLGRNLPLSKLRRAVLFQRVRPGLGKRQQPFPIAITEVHHRQLGAHFLFRHATLLRPIRFENFLQRRRVRNPAGQAGVAGATMQARCNLRAARRIPSRILMAKLRSLSFRGNR